MTLANEVEALCPCGRNNCQPCPSCYSVERHDPTCMLCRDLARRVEEMERDYATMEDEKCNLLEKLEAVVRAAGNDRLIAYVHGFKGKP